MNIVFFIRAYNDIDSVAPVAYKLLSNGVTDRLYFVNQSASRSFDQDFRIQYLRTLGEIIYIESADHAGCKGVINLTDRLRDPLCSRRIGEIAFNRIMLPALKRNQEKTLQRFDFSTLPLAAGEPAVFLFDYNTSTLARRGFRFARERGIPVGLMPHGLRTIDHRGLLQHQREARTIEGLDNYNQADVLFANNENFAATFPSVAPERFRLVGSARYCQEWSDILEGITPACDLPEPGEHTVRFCVMLSKWQYDVWKKASLWTIRHLASQEDTVTVVKPHTRGMDVKAELGGHENLIIAGDDTHSRRLIQWADVTLFWKSSIFVDALLMDKPLLHMHYATSFRLACAHMVDGWNINSREDTMEWVHRFREDRTTRTYSPEERRACLDYFVDDERGDVLQRHVDAIVEMAERAAVWK